MINQKGIKKLLEVKKEKKIFIQCDGKIAVTNGHWLVFVLDVDFPKSESGKIGIQFENGKDWPTSITKETVKQIVGEADIVAWRTGWNYFMGKVDATELNNDLEGQQSVFVNRGYHEWIMSLYPNAELFISTDKKPVHYKIGEHIVAVCMPVNAGHVPARKEV